MLIQDVIETLNIKVNHVNHLPIITLIPAVRFGEDMFNDSVDLDDYVSDMEDSPEELTWKAEWADQVHVTIADDHKVKFTADQNWYGWQDINFTVRDTEGGEASQIVRVTVVRLNDDPATIASVSPERQIVIVPNIPGYTIAFAVTAKNTEEAGYYITWHLDNEIAANNTDSYNYISTNDSKTRTVRAKLTSLDTVQERIWTIQQASSPVTTYLGTIRNVDAINSANFSGLTMYTSKALIDFGNQTIDLTGFVDVDANVLLAAGAAGINTASYPNLNKPAHIELYGLQYSQQPKLYYNTGFGATGTTECPQSICQNIAYESGTLSFDVNQFSTYFVGTGSGNHIPRIQTSPVTVAYVNESYTYDINAIDDDSQSLIYSLTKKPAGMTIDPSTGVISWMPTNNSDAVVAVTVSDGIDTVVQQFTIDVRKRSLLSITELDVKVGSEKDEGLSDGNTISETASPGDKLVFNIEVANDDANDEMRDVSVEVEIENIDDNSDISEESDETDIDEEDSEDFKAELVVPDDADEGTFTVNIRVSGKNSDDEPQDFTWKLYLEVERNNHEIRIVEADLIPDTISCDKNSDLIVSIENMGQDDEDSVSLEIESTALNIRSRVTNIELSADTDDDENSYEQTFQLNLPQNLKPGTYPITVRTYYDSRSSDTATVNLNVAACVQATTTTTSTAGKNEQIVLQAVPVSTASFSTGTTQPAAQPDTIVSFQDSEYYTLLLIILAIILSGAVIFLSGAVVILAKKKR